MERVHFATFLFVLGMLLAVSPKLDAADLPSSRAHPTYIIDQWDTEKGLPQNEVTTILQTHDGYLWFGTPNGLVRFDGFRFTVFDEDSTPGLNSGRIISLFEDRQGDLWVGTDSAGVTLFREGRGLSVELGSHDHPAKLVSACQDGQGSVWLYMAQGQLWRVGQQSTNLFVVGAERSSDYRSVIADKSGQVWVGTGWRVFGISTNTVSKPPDLVVAQTAAGTKLDTAVGKLDFLLASRRGGYWQLSDGRVYRFIAGETEPEVAWKWYPWVGSAGLGGVSAACEDAEGNLVVGTRDQGVFWYDAEGTATCISTNNGLSNNHILALHVDREGDLWVGTDGGGLNRVKRPVFELIEGTHGRVVQSTASDNSGGLWAASTGFQLEYYGQTPKSYRLFANTLLIDRQQRLWAGTSGAGLFLKEEQEIHPFPGTQDWWVSALHQDRQGRLWVGTERGLACWVGREWKLFSTQQGLSANAVQAIADDESGRLWIATRNGGLNVLHDGKIQVVRKSQGGLPSDRLWSLYVDRDQVLWVGTDGAGLARLEQGHWTRFTRRDGLISNSIVYILEDGEGFLWLGSNAGLMRVDKRSLNQFVRGSTNLIPCRVYGRADGLPIGECTSGSQPAASRAVNGRLYFPTIQGLVSVDPALLKPNLSPPPVRIETVLIDGQASDKPPFGAGKTAGVQLNSSNERLEIQFTRANLSAPERARFRYWLEGHETGWTEGQTRVAQYSRLTPGHYLFHVTACNEDGVWNSVGTTLAITVLPPFWRTWWFVAITSIVLLGIVSGIVHYASTQKLQRQLAFARQRETLERERSRIARDIHDQLGANLTQVALLGELVESDKDTPGEVELHARQISQTARDTTRVLDEIVWAVNPSNDTLDGLITYICKHAQEYLAVAGLHCRLEFPDRLPGTPLPPDVRHNVFLACKESITNVVRHAQATEVRLRLQVTSEVFRLEIQDNGNGPAGSEAKLQNRNGLRNMRQRLESIGGHFALQAAPGGGTLVCLTAPLATKSNDVDLT